jgi:hypothetical protein
MARTADRAVRLLEIRRAIRPVGTDVSPAMSSSPEIFALDAEGLDR